MRIVWTGRYLHQLEEIGDYIARCSPRAAARVVNEIHTKAKRLLSGNPFIGRAGEIDGTRELVITGTPYIVAYRVTDTQARGNGPTRLDREALARRCTCSAVPELYIRS